MKIVYLIQGERFCCELFWSCKKHFIVDRLPSDQSNVHLDAKANLAKAPGIPCVVQDHPISRQYFGDQSLPTSVLYFLVEPVNNQST